jgi:hypothetical protein
VEMSGQNCAELGRAGDDLIAVVRYIDGRLGCLSTEEMQVAD